MRARSRPWLLTWALLVAGCHCARGPSRSEEKVLQLVPADAEGVLVVPRLAVATARFGDLASAVAKIPGGQILQEALMDFIVQLRADPRTPVGLADLGLDPDGSAAAWLPAGAPAENAVLALPARDAAQAEKR